MTVACSCKIAHVTLNVCAHYFGKNRPPVKCGFADMRIFEVVKCGEILQILSLDVMGKMRMWRCGYVNNEHVCLYLHGSFGFKRGADGLTWVGLTNLLEYTY